MIDKLTYINSQDLFADASAIIETAKNIACRSINITLVQRNWLLGKRIAEEQLGDQTREELYGQKPICFDANGAICTGYMHRHYDLIKTYLQYMEIDDSQLGMLIMQPDEWIQKVEELKTGI